MDQLSKMEEVQGKSSVEVMANLLKTHKVNVKQ
jgi:hypothetical protein